MTITPTNINKHPEPKPAFRFGFDVSTGNQLYFHNSDVSILNLHVFTASVDRTPMKLARSPNIHPETIRIRFPSNPGGNIVIG